MSNRLLSVTAHTTLDYVDALATGYEFEFDSVGVVNATTDREEPAEVQLQVELDNRTEAHFPKHVVELQLEPEQARKLAGELEEHAARVEDGAVDT
ncbi:DUF6360 family protein [Halostagnicola kamekurae]|uniref:Uncharacterized protein n=1 Tax=Halostagnicola kamekurae TaxID=619731 RepID=A0A1I6RGI5_9EURY|nr:DUF6360 family protein [Halostagnicola kamekurae]SFS63827.1 hypothetical protein SAMN04488556_1780 [Halostagnicola kamekurae]